MRSLSLICTARAADPRLMVFADELAVEQEAPADADCELWQALYPGDLR